MAWEDLAIAVIQQAIDDALSEEVTLFRGHKTPTQADKDEAISFLKGEKWYGPTLEYWCQCSGAVDSSALISFANKIPEHKKNVDFATKNNIIDNVVKIKKKGGHFGKRNTKGCRRTKRRD